MDHDPLAATWFARVGQDAATTHARLRDLLREGNQRWVAAMGTRLRLVTERVAAREVAGEVLGWSRRLNAALRLLVRAHPSRRQAAQRVWEQRKLRSVRIAGALAELRRVLPELRAYHGELAPHLGELDPLGEGEALLERMERQHRRVQAARDRAERRTAALATHREVLRQELRQVRRTWRLLHALSEGALPDLDWQVVRHHQAMRKRRRARLTRRQRAAAVVT